MSMQAAESFDQSDEDTDLRYVLVITVPDGLLGDESIENVSRIVNEALGAVVWSPRLSARPLSEVLAC